MKALVSLVLAVALIAGIYIASTSGCGARAQVAGDKLLKKIDGWLGELDVKRKKIQNKIEELDNAIKQSAEAKDFERFAALQTEKKSLQEKMSTTANFVKVVASNGRMDCLAAIQSSVQQMADEMAGRIKATMTTAEPVDDETRANVARELSKVLGKEVKVESRIDPGSF